MEPTLQPGDDGDAVREVTCSYSNEEYGRKTL
jgi:hypothetical protein